jgi:hypothetical protein
VKKEQNKEKTRKDDLVWLCGERERWIEYERRGYLLLETVDGY